MINCGNRKKPQCLNSPEICNWNTELEKCEKKNKDIKTVRCAGRKEENCLKASDKCKWNGLKCENTVEPVVKKTVEKAVKKAESIEKAVEKPVKKAVKKVVKKAESVKKAETSNLNYLSMLDDDSLNQIILQVINTSIDDFVNLNASYSRIKPLYLRHQPPRYEEKWSYLIVKLMHDHYIAFESTVDPRKRSEHVYQTRYNLKNTNKQISISYMGGEFHCITSDAKIGYTKIPHRMVDQDDKELSYNRVYTDDNENSQKSYAGPGVDANGVVPNTIPKRVKIDPYVDPYIDNVGVNRDYEVDEEIDIVLEQADTIDFENDKKYFRVRSPLNTSIQGYYKRWDKEKLGNFEVGYLNVYIDPEIIQYNIQNNKKKNLKNFEEFMELFVNRQHDVNLNLPKETIQYLYESDIVYSLIKDASNIKTGKRKSISVNCFDVMKEHMFKDDDYIDGEMIVEKIEYKPDGVQTRTEVSFANIYNDNNFLIYLIKLRKLQESILSKQRQYTNVLNMRKTLKSLAKNEPKNIKLILYYARDYFEHLIRYKNVNYIDVMYTINQWKEANWSQPSIIFENPILLPQIEKESNIFKQPVYIYINKDGESYWEYDAEPEYANLIAIFEHSGCMLLPRYGQVSYNDSSDSSDSEKIKWFYMKKDKNKYFKEAEEVEEIKTMKHSIEEWNNSLELGKKQKNQNTTHMAIYFPKIIKHQTGGSGMKQNKTMEYLLDKYTRLSSL